MSDEPVDELRLTPPPEPVQYPLPCPVCGAEPGEPCRPVPRLTS